MAVSKAKAHSGAFFHYRSSVSGLCASRPNGEPAGSVYGHAHRVRLTGSLPATSVRPFLYQTSAGSTVVGTITTTGRRHLITGPVRSRAPFPAVR